VLKNAVFHADEKFPVLLLSNLTQKSAIGCITDIHNGFIYYTLNGFALLTAGIEGHHDEN